jgi:hypothetical protein
MVTVLMPALKQTGVAMNPHAPGNVPDEAHEAAAAIGGMVFSPGAMRRKASARQSATRTDAKARATNRSSWGERCLASNLCAAKRI